VTSAAGPGFLTFVGTAATIIRFGGFTTLLTDPNFLHRGQRAYMGYGPSSVGRAEPGQTVDELPDLIAIVLSHLHGDHWDRLGTRAWITISRCSPRRMRRVVCSGEGT
jgi:L-ascorbate metabolism protein UlaG (beta-lactamase superfamily)